MKKHEKIDISLVSGARPGLLRETLESFYSKLFKNFDLQTLYVNIDPFEGGPEEVETCELICREYFSEVVSRKPDKPHFTKAVRWLWSRPKADWCFHLEDDWVLSREVSLQEFHDAQKRNVAQISLMTREKNWGYRSMYHYEPSRLTFLGRDLGKSLNRRRPIFTTSPSFVRRDFAHRCAELMNDTLDPEKQLNTLNPELNAYTADFRNHFIGARREFVAIDIGRQHRDEHGITKTVIDGNSVWTNEEN
ncbi:hypothetical protein ABLO27_13125 [Roseibium sp. SCPC15]|uniref:hypothetical protein n=1 Tax=Roseibium sp. SCP15 TaxID=3141376 RepID=UPI003335403F